VKFNILMRIILCGVLGLGLIVGCSEKPVSGIDYEAEMRRFIEEDPDGIELYSVDIFPDSSASFKLDDSDDLYFYVIDNNSRTYAYDISNKYDTLFGFNDILDAVVTVNDLITGKVYRIRGDDTTRAYGLEVRLQRYAYFLKIYGTAYQYHGWRFWAYSCLNYTSDGYFKNTSDDSIPATLTRENLIRGVYNKLGSYVVLKNDIVKMPLSDSLSYYSRFQNRLFAENGNEELEAFRNDLPTGQQFYTGWRLPASSDRLYHLITIDSDTTGYNFREEEDNEGSVIDSVMVKQGDIVIPYAVDI